MTMMAAVSISALTAACGSGSAAPPIAIVPATNPVTQAPSTADQQLQSIKTVGPDVALDRGILTYTPLTTLAVDAPVEFYITVIDVGRGPQLTSVPTKYHGQAVDPYNIPTSAGVEVKIVCSSDLQCQDQTSQDSQFVNPQREGYWRWSVTAQNPGTAFIDITAVTYDKDSGAFIYSPPLWTIPLKVKATGV
jgi:hypothetical protein